MSSYDTIVTRADFVPTVVGQQADRSVSSATSAHDGTSQQPRPEVHETQLNVLANVKYREPWDAADNADSQMARYPRNREGERARRPSPLPIYQ